METKVVLLLSLLLLLVVVLALVMMNILPYLLTEQLLYQELVMTRLIPKYF